MGEWLDQQAPVSSVQTFPSYPIDASQFGVLADVSNRFVGTMTNGSAVLEDLTNGFPASAIGQKILVEGEGAAAPSVDRYSLAAIIGSYASDQFHVNLVNAAGNPVTAQAAGTVNGLTYHRYTTDNGPLIQAALAALPGSTTAGQVMIAGNSFEFAIEQPIQLKQFQRLLGNGGWSVTKLRAGVNYPRCTTTGFTVPALPATTFTITVDAVPPYLLNLANFPDGVGVWSCGGCEGTYTGVTPTTLTGCQSRYSNVVVPNGRVLATPMLNGPTAHTGGFSYGAEYLTLIGSFLGGVSGCLMYNPQETAGLQFVQIFDVDCFGYRVSRDPNGAGTNPLDWTAHEVNVALGSTCDPLSVGIDWEFPSGSNVAGGHRGLRDSSIVQSTPNGGGGGTITSKAAARMNGLKSGRWGELHIESHPTGVLIGDKAACLGVSVDGIEAGNTAGLVNLVQIASPSSGATAQIVSLRNLHIANPAAYPSRRLINDLLSGNTVLESDLGEYLLGADGKIRTDSVTAEFNVRQGQGPNPGINALKAWTGAPEWNGANTTAAVLGTLYMMKVDPRASQVTLSDVWINVTANTLGTVANCFFSAWIVSGTTAVLIGSVDASSVITGSATGLLHKTLTVVGGQSLTQPANVDIYLGVLLNAGSGAITLRSDGSVTQRNTNLTTAAPGLRQGVGGTGLAALPASPLNLTSIVQANSIAYWLAAS